MLPKDFLYFVISEFVTRILCDRPIRPIMKSGWRVWTSIFKSFPMDLCQLVSNWDTHTRTHIFKHTKQTFLNCAVQILLCGERFETQGVLTWGRLRMHSKQQIRKGESVYTLSGKCVYTDTLDWNCLSCGCKWYIELCQLWQKQRCCCYFFI